MPRHLSTENFLYGSQYYRAPSPPPSDWKGDLERMRDLGFNTVKFWIQWRWNHPGPDRFAFDDIDRLMDLSGDLGLGVMLNTIVDVAPAWIYERYPDASMVTLRGERIGPQTQPHRQIGGLGICLNHPGVTEEMMRFLEEAVSRYSGHPALTIWNVGSEPELTQSMAEMRRWADDASQMGDMLCHCDHCRREFKTWLAGRYSGIEALNTAWNRNYTSFDQVEVPRTRNTFNDVVDWRMFFVDSLGRNVRQRFEVAGRIDQGRHPLMCHHVFIQGFPVTSTASDPWNVGPLGDLHGFTQMDDPMMHDILRSCARGKTVISAEMLMLMGYTLDLPNRIGEQDIRRHIFTGIAANLKGFLFWQYRPEMLGREAPTWGLAHPDGSSTPWLESFSRTGRLLQEQAEFLHGAEPEPAEVAVLYSPENQVFAWASTGSEKTATEALQGTHQALYEANYRIDFVHPSDLVRGDLDAYKVLVIPFPYFLSAESCQTIQEWVRRGGTLISECFAAAWNVAEGRHESTIPGNGLHEIFGVRQLNAEPAPGGRRRLAVGVDSHEELALTCDDGGGLRYVDAVTSLDLDTLPAGTVVRLASVKETYLLEGAEVLASYADGQAAVTRATFGKGTAIQLGGYLGIGVHRAIGKNNAAFLAALVGEFADIKRPLAAGSVLVRVDTLQERDGEGVMLILRNLEKVRVHADVEVPFRLPSGLTCLYSGTEYSTGGAEAASRLSVRLEPDEVLVLKGSLAPG